MSLPVNVDLFISYEPNTVLIPLVMLGPFLFFFFFLFLRIYLRQFNVEVKGIRL